MKRIIKSKRSPNKKWSFNEWFKAKTEVEEKVLIEVLEWHLKRKIVQADAKDCFKSYYLDDKFNYAFGYKNEKIGNISITQCSKSFVQVEFYTE